MFGSLIAGLHGTRFRRGWQLQLKPANQHPLTRQVAPSPAAGALAAPTRRTSQPSKRRLHLLAMKRHHVDRLQMMHSQPAKRFILLTAKATLCTTAKVSNSHWLWLDAVPQPYRSSGLAKATTIL